MLLGWHRVMGDAVAVGTRIALIGNMNNSFFSIARSLRDRGVDAELLLTDGSLPHFHPSWDAFDLEYRRFTRQLTWGHDESFFRTSPARVREDLGGMEFLVVCGAVPAYLHAAGLRADVVIPYGADLYELPRVRLPWAGWRTNLSRWRRRRFHDAQRRGLQEARLVNWGGEVDVLQAPIERLGLEGTTRYLGLPAVYGGLYRPGFSDRYLTRSAWGHAFRELRQRFDLLVVHHSRHIWATYIDEFSAKGNDVLLRGFAELRRRRPAVEVGLATFEYGPDVQASRDLATELGITGRVVWLPAMARKEIMLLLDLADVATGQFVHGTPGCGAVYEVVAVGTPLIHHRSTATRHADRFDYPYFEAASPESVADVLEVAIEDPDRLRVVGAGGAEWYHERFEKRAIDALVDLIGGPSRA